ncbi:ParM/StbA family protein [Microaerobacter geothermalis]|uniref:ParM/StbA family protein n=1 Tax=Microaerobacter geothermalis TaxID=674972 RepID=UPI001F231FAF|nr:ParM/StbA family protein [Microaerobacter geothermalis]MCF6094514.1 ParM/StbA family protein [Microaerobacter geothermalis]
MFKVSVDPGYGYIKAINGEGDQVRFPSIVGMAHNLNLNRALGGLIGDKRDEDELKKLHIRYEDDQASGEFFVGELARKSKNASYCFEQNKINHQHTRILIATAAALLAPEGKNIWLGAGLPLEYFEAQKNEMKRMLTNFQAKITFVEKNKTKQIKFDRVSIYAQGVASIYDGLLYPNGRPRYPQFMRPGNLIAAVNWGTRTVDVAVYEVLEGSLEIRGDLCFTLDDAGAMEIRRIVQQAFQEKSGYPISILDAEKIILQKGYIFFNGREYDLSKEIMAAKKHITQLVIDALQTKLGNQTSFIRAIFLTGGVVEDVRDVLDLNKLKTETIIIPDPQFADARGMLHMIRLEERIELQKKKNNGELFSDIG